MRIFLGYIAALMMAGTMPAAAEQRSLVVVELFTSQGCSSCPAADAYLAKLAEYPDVLPLALHVDYWDYIGWKDTFAQAAFTERQNGYRLAARQRYKFTPQMIIAGQTQAVGNRPMEVATALSKHRGMVDAASIQRIEDADGQPILRIRALSSAHLPAHMIAQVVYFTPENLVEITRGENAGRTIKYTNVVTSVETLSDWDGSGDLDVAVPKLGGGGVAIVLQERTEKGYPGAIHATLRLQ